MRRIFWLLLLLVAPSELVAQIGYPAPPSPLPLNLPNCPMRLMGKANGIWYWGTQTCTSPYSSGFGQTTGEVPTGCTNGMCNHPVTLFELRVREDNAEEMPGFRLSACGLPQSTPMELADKLKAIIKETKKLELYLRKLEKAREELTVDHRQRIQIWREYLCCLLAYLEDTSAGADPVEVRIANYCTSVKGRKSVTETYREHEAAWGKTFVDGVSGRAFILDEKQKAPLVSADLVILEKAPGFSVTDHGVYMVTVNNLATPSPADDVSKDQLPENSTQDDLLEYSSKTVYFKTFTFQKADDSRVYSHVGIQVLDPGTYTANPATLTNRNTFGHMIKANPGSAYFLVSSVDDLSIAP